MSRTLTIIMLDFFVMISIAFFVLQYIQPTDEAQSAPSRRPPFTIINISVDHQSFYKSTKIQSAELSSLLVFGFSLRIGDIELAPDTYRVGYTYDGANIVYQGRAEGHKTLLVYAKDILSIPFLESVPTLSIKAITPTKPATEQTIPLNILHTGVLVVDLG